MWRHPRQRGAAPESRQLYAERGGHPGPQYQYPFTDRPGEVTRIETATLSRRIDGAVDFQGAHEEVVNGDCSDVEPIEILGSGDYACLHGDYVVDVGSDVQCAGNGLEVTLEAGKATYVTHHR